MNARPNILIGWYEEDNGRRRRVEIEPELRDENGRLILAVTFRAGRARKSDGTFMRNRFDEPREYSGGSGMDEVEAVTQFAAGWSADRRDRLAEIARRWHLNDMNAACEHQRALGWTYESHAGQDCPECGYRIGTAWLYEELPGDVVDFMRTVIG